MAETPTIKKRIISAVLGWAVPGLGHIVIGQRWRGLLFLVMLVPLYVVGLHLGDFSIISSKEHPVYFLLQMFNGSGLFVWKLFKPEMMTRTSILAYDAGKLYTCVASLLNLLVIMHLFVMPKKSDTDGETEK